MSLLARARNALAAALDGSGDPVEFTADDQILFRPETRDPAHGGDPNTVVVVRTSGSTGTPKQTLLTGGALRASAAATAARIGGEGHWLLAVGLQYVAGLAVLSRSILAGTTPVGLPAGAFTPDTFNTAAEKLFGPRANDDFHAISLVPTQLTRLLDDATATRYLARFDAILVGGAAVPDTLREHARRAQLNLHLTYGMSETCGGCIYDGVPLDGVFVDTLSGPDTVTASSDSKQSVPRLRISGPMVAAGYFDDPVRTAEHFGTGPHGRRYLTDDTGTIALADVATPAEEPGDRTLQQRIEVTGRIDDVINTGGVKVSAAAVQRLLHSVPEVEDAFVAGIPNEEWGQLVCAAVVVDDSGISGSITALEEALSDRVRSELGAAAVPKRWVYRGWLPLLANGKTDRQALRRMFEQGDQNA